MIFTEEEACNRWCPHARQLGQAGGAWISGFNRIDRGDIPACIATSCMAWRWYDPAQPLRDIDLVTSDVVDLQPRRGYCGLSGRPEHGD